MFRKTLTALTLMGVASQGIASALTVTEKVLSPQAATTLTEVAAGTIELQTAQASIASGAIAQFTFTKAPKLPATITAAKSAAGTAQNSTCGALSYSGASNDGKTLNYTTTGTTAAGCKITLTGTKFAIADVGASPIQVSASFSDVGAGIDPALPKDVATITGYPQFVLTAPTKIASLVDVEKDRYELTAASQLKLVTTNSNAATQIDTTTNAQNGTVTGATATSVTYVISGDFSWAENISEDPVVPGFQLASGAIACANAGGTVTVGSGANKPSATAYTFSVNQLDETVCDFTPQNKALKVVLAQQAFSTSGTVAFNDVAATPVAGTQALAATKSGAWGINGASIKVFAVPFGPEVESHSIFVSNKGTATGALTGSMVWNGNDAVSIDLGNVEAGATKYVNVIGALKAAGELPPFGRADIVFTANAPAADITFTAGYNTAAGRTNLFVQQQATIDTISEANN